MFEPPRKSAFSKEEFELRWGRARELMQAKGLDALLVTNPSNYTYFVGTGYGWGARRNAFILPIDKEPVVLVNGAQKHATEFQTYISDVRWYHLPFRPALVADILSGLGLARGRVGAEFRHDYMTSICFEVKELMEEATFTDATEILQRLRMIKTDNEVEAIRDACLHHTNAMQEMLGKIRGGMTVREVGWVLAECEKEHEATSVSTGIGLLDVWNTDGKGEWLRRKKDPGRKLRGGDYVCFDYGVMGSKGYGADFGATFVVGRPLPEHVEWWEKCVYIMKRWMEVTKPGVRMSDAHTQACEAVREAGLDPNNFGGCHTIHRSHYAHGIGIDLVEEPMAAAYEQREFEPGMTLCIEPECVGSEGEGAPRMMHREEIVVLTDGGYDRLTTMDWDLHTITEN